MEKAIFHEPGSPIRFDMAQGQPAKSGHMEHHAAPEWETQPIAGGEAGYYSLQWHTEGIRRRPPLKIDPNFWRCGEPGNWCKCANPIECGYIEIHAKISQL